MGAPGSGCADKVHHRRVPARGLPVRRQQQPAATRLSIRVPRQEVNGSPVSGGREPEHRTSSSFRRDPIDSSGAPPTVVAGAAIRHARPCTMSNFGHERGPNDTSKSTARAVRRTCRRRGKFHRLSRLWSSFGNSALRFAFRRCPAAPSVQSPRRRTANSSLPTSITTRSRSSLRLVLKN